LKVVKAQHDINASFAKLWTKTFIAIACNIEGFNKRPTHQHQFKSKRNNTIGSSTVEQY